MITKEKAMEKRLFGKTGMNVSVLGFGGAEIGYGSVPQAQAEKLLQSALDAGLNVVDTAECYLTSEELIGQAIGARRNDYYLFTKCGHSRGYEDTDWHDAHRLQESLDRSLQRLRTDYVDLLQLHSCSKDVLAKGDVIEFLQKARAAGKTRFIGYSGDSHDALYAVNTGAFDTLQISVSIADQESIDLVLPKAARRGMGVIAKRPVANAVWRYPQKPDADYYVPYWERMRELKYDFAQDGHAFDTAIRFTLSVPGVHVAIVGTATPGRWQENAKVVAKGPLEKEEFEKIRTVWRARAKKEWVGQI
jgi:aryl-alcohol dehydrogenase-like predicted oxidoreductase